ncbi:MAG: tRNA uridine-5-carboxymethylaminomethyl(34) synthesis GTPase MnmE [Bacteroidales bacterium]|nr:tRNA uridine-5-carboxymethylaminomethyl(34) synthesis GTPase MnmE [Bacteroidales bacterium]
MDSIYQDTIVAPATVPGTGAISIVRISGQKALEIADAVVKVSKGNLLSAKGYTIHYGNVYEADGELLDQVLVSVFRSPRSYTGEDSVEISTHASRYIVQRLVELLLASGARFAQPGEFTRRAFLNGKMDLAQAESVADVISSTTEAAHHIAMSQFRGGFSKELEALRGRLLEMASLLELELDFSEEEVEFAKRDQLLELVEATLSQVNSLADSFHQGDMIKNGVPVAIVGVANAGKSSLLNALLGDDRAIVSAIPGTTRDTVEEVAVLDGVAFRFIDTAGLRDSSDTVEKLGIERSYRKLSSAEIVLGVLDFASDSLSLQQQVSQILSGVDTRSQKLVFVLSKADLLDENEVNKNVTNINNFVSYADIKADIIAISSKSSESVNELKKRLSSIEKSLISNAASSLVTNIRHYEALRNAASALSEVKVSLSANVPGDLVAEDLRRALSFINSILGKDLGLDPETILHHIFKNHCIGK